MMKLKKYMQQTSTQEAFTKKNQNIKTDTVMTLPSAFAGEAFPSIDQYFLRMFILPKGSKPSVNSFHSQTYSIYSLLNLIIKPTPNLKRLEIRKGGRTKTAPKSSSDKSLFCSFRNQILCEAKCPEDRAQINYP